MESLFPNCDKISYSPSFMNIAKMSFPKSTKMSFPKSSIGNPYSFNLLDSRFRGNDRRGSNDKETRGNDNTQPCHSESTFYRTSPSESSYFMISSRHSEPSFCYSECQQRISTPPPCHSERSEESPHLRFFSKKRRSFGSKIRSLRMTRMGYYRKPPKCHSRNLLSGIQYVLNL